MIKITRRSSQKVLTWWNSHLHRMRRKTRRVRKAYQRKRNIEKGYRKESPSWRAWKVGAAKYASIINRSRASKWEDLVEVEGNRNPWGKVYKICLGKTRRTDLAQIEVSRGWTTNWSESSRALLDEFFPWDNGAPRDETLLEGPGDDIQEFANLDIACAMRKVKLGKASGLDGITNEVVRMVWRTVPAFLKATYDECLRTGTFPTIWKDARVVTILKSADRDRSKPRSYRPISLLIWGRFLNV